jgi:hypothetical protein
MLKQLCDFPDAPPELIITGTVRRSEPVRSNVNSLAMRAKLCGFQFCLDDGKLLPLPAHLVLQPT